MNYSLSIESRVWEKGLSYGKEVTEEMSILSRIATLIKANINDLINKAEDPEKILNQTIIDMRSQLNEARKQVAAAIADEKRLQQQYEAEVQQAKEWEKKAMAAVEKGEDGLAKEALSRKISHEKMALEYKKQWESQKEETDKLRETLRSLNQKIEEASRKKNLLIAKQKRAQAQKRISQTMSKLSDVSAFDTFDRMAAKVERMEAEAIAATELSEELSGEALEKKFLDLEIEDDAEKALAELKTKMGK